MTSGADDPTALNLETAATPSTLSAASGVTCAGCQRTLDTQYYDVNGNAVCEACRDTVARQARTPRDGMTFAKAVAFGIGAALAGAVLYYAVIAITNLEIGLVAVAIGYMVGYSVKHATGGRGGRRFQVLAVALTYWAVGLAYLPLAMQGVLERAPDAGRGLLMLVTGAMVLSLGLPVLSVLGSMPGGLLSAAIIAFGMHQAWQMTAAPQLQVSGPYRVGAAGSHG